jgi:hypothetical protein
MIFRKDASNRIPSEAGVLRNFVLMLRFFRGDADAPRIGVELRSRAASGKPADPGATGRRRAGAPPRLVGLSFPGSGTDGPVRSVVAANTRHRSIRRAISDHRDDRGTKKEAPAGASDNVSSYF